MTLPFPRDGAGRRSRGRGPGGAGGDPADRLRPLRRRRPCCARATSTTAWPGRATRSARRSPGRCPTCRRCCSAAAWTRARRWRTRAPRPRSCRTRRSSPSRARATTRSTATSPAAPAQALARFIDDVAVGHPCLGQDNGVRPTPLPPRSLTRLPLGARRRRQPRARAVRRARHRHRRAPEPRCRRCSPACRCSGGGLRGGSFSGEASFEGRLRLRGYAFVPGLRVSGSLSTSEGSISGTVHVSGSGERHPEDQPPGHGDRHARRPSRALPARRGSAAAATLRDGGSLWPRDVRAAPRAGDPVAGSPAPPA